MTKVKTKNKINKELPNSSDGFGLYFFRILLVSIFVSASIGVFGEMRLYGS